MKILVYIRRVPDIDQKIQISSDGNVDGTDLRYDINPFDAVALEEALRMREKIGPGEVLCVAVGTDELETQLRTALAMGADRALLANTDSQIDHWNSAVLLQKIVGAECPRIVLVGERMAEDDADMTGPFLAALLDWPQATFASQITVLGNDVQVGRETDQGIETITLPLPTVVTCGLRLNEPRYASFRGQMKARSMPIERVFPNDLSNDLQPTVKTLNLKLEGSKRDCVFVDSVDELVHILQFVAKIHE
ncbi:MAG: electron transfer flavoprotein subunit beta/FixA family protein [Anaerolineales bacterium]|nr:electron transfer flavoprotein subunit beta/FixA family protein [Anaerolineales bacterium]